MDSRIMQGLNATNQTISSDNWTMPTDLHRYIDNLNGTERSGHMAVEHLQAVSDLDKLVREHHYSSVAELLNDTKSPQPTSLHARNADPGFPRKNVDVELSNGRLFREMQSSKPELLGRKPGFAQIRAVMVLVFVIVVVVAIISTRIRKRRVRDGEMEMEGETENLKPIEV